MFRRNGLGQTLKDPIEVGAIMVGNSDPLTWLDPTRWLRRGEAGANEQTEGPTLLPHPTHTPNLRPCRDLVNDLEAPSIFNNPVIEILNSSPQW